MRFTHLRQCLSWLENQNELIRIPFEVDPDQEMAQITLRVFEAGGPALLFERVKNSPFQAVSNLYGTYDRCLKIFQPQIDQIKHLVDLRSDPVKGIRHPNRGFSALKALVHALPIRQRQAPVMASTTRVNQLPQVRCWPGDGGAFILLPQVCSQDPHKKGVLRSNLGMYRIQISGNDYQANQEIGLHYQIHRGIADHHKKALEMGEPLKVSIFIGGPPSHALAAVMPLPEGVPELAFAGALSGYNFRYLVNNGYIISADADFCITGTIVADQTKPEGPFGDHLGYYSNVHEFPFLKIDRVYHRKNPVLPFTVVGRPPQEDSNFGRLIHEMTRQAVSDTIPGVVSVNAVDDAGVHPLLLVKAHERYVPFEERRPQEILTTAMAVLGTGQLSLAKYLFICAHEDNPELNVGQEQDVFIHILERLDLQTGLHFITQTTMDTLDYSHDGLNRGSKLIIAAAGQPRRSLGRQIDAAFTVPESFDKPDMAAPGIIVVEGPRFSDYHNTADEMGAFCRHLACQPGIDGFPLVVVVDDSGFASRTFSNFLWVTFTRSNPSHDIYGPDEQVIFKHWQCGNPLVIDARVKPFHAGVLEPDPEVKKRVDALGAKGGPLNGII
ncbi:MAG: UbiD family decarboxylase [Desulfobacteraceae bacterium]|nr:MAG: UbiD family decarboxylase [Desulfobacteraceae bacterium]